MSNLGGLAVGAEDFLAAVLRTVAQPVWVVDHQGLIRFANPAAAEALGYDSPADLFGRPSHETIHYKRPDGSPYPAAECPMLLPRKTGETVSTELDWFIRRDGSMFPVSYVSVPLEMPQGRGAVVAFSDIEARRRAQERLREREALLADELASLRRVATLATSGAPSTEVFAAIVKEVARVMCLPIVSAARYEPDGSAMTILAETSDRPTVFRAGTSWSLDAPSLALHVLRGGRSGRLDRIAPSPGAIAQASLDSGIRGVAAAPIVVDGRVWGVMAAASRDEPLPEGIEDRLADFTALVATAISNSEARDDLGRLAAEQAALRRVATLVAEGATPDDVFAAVAREFSRIMRLPIVSMYRYEPDGTATVAGAIGEHPFQAGTNWPLDSPTLPFLVRESGRPATLGDYHDIPGTIGQAAEQAGIQAGVGAPIVVDGKLWGAVSACSDRCEPIPPDAGERLSRFTALVATAISNAEARAELVTSRVRIVEAADEQRRQVVRDLHDGAQQRLVHTILMLQLARRELGDRVPAAAGLLEDALANAEEATNELRELAHGILPAGLIRGGLRAGLTALASRAAVPVALEVPVTRFPPSVEATSYFVVAEALTNVSKHARARTARVQVAVEDGALRIEIRDDGVGGARLGGPGLVGMRDRLSALEGRLRVDSPAGGGTIVTASIPLPP